MWDIEGAGAFLRTDDKRESRSVAPSPRFRLSGGALFLLRIALLLCFGSTAGVALAFYILIGYAPLSYVFGGLLALGAYAHTYPAEGGSDSQPGEIHSPTEATDSRPSPLPEVA